MLKKILISLIFFYGAFSGYGQEGFFIENGRKSAKIKFSLVNNLIIVPVELNGAQLSFLLDTGVNTTVLLNLEKADSLQLKNAQKVNLRGLGGEELIEAYKSENNHLKMGNATSKNLTVYLIYNEEVNFSPRLGVPVNGIIGYDFFKDFVVEINYARQFLRVYDPDGFNKRLNNYNEVILRFYQNKPYIQSRVEIEDQEVVATLLIDNGLGDALWLFNENSDIKVPEKSFDDFLGLGLLGDVIGKRSRIKSLELGGYKLKDVTAAFPDSISVEGLRMFEARNGSVGAEILRRFNMYIDYGIQRMFLRKNKNFNDPFNYDMSGIILEHSGFVIVETYMSVPEPEGKYDQGEVVVIPERQTRKSFELQPSFHIVGIRKDSPAYRAGLQVGDVLISINGRDAYRYKLEDITALFSSEEGKKIRMEVSRGLQNLKFEFRLEKLL